MKKIILSVIAVIMSAGLFSSCEKNPEPGTITPTPRYYVYQVSVKLPANYQAQGVDAVVPEAILSSLCITADEFKSEFGKTVKFGSATSADPSSVKWESENNGGKYGHWFDANGNVVSSTGAKVLHCQSNCQWGSSTANITSFNVNLAESAYAQGTSYKAYQAIGREREGVTDIAFIEWTVNVNEEKPFATATTSFSMTTGIVASIKMIPTSNGTEYSTLEVELPDAVYATVKSISGYDALAYFITSGQIKSYAFPKAASVGAEGTSFWFDGTGAVAQESSAVIKTDLYLESGNPLSGGGRDVKLIVTPKIGASVTAGSTFNCGYIFVYGTMKIPLIANVTVVNSL